jgi:hypothetical protein
MSKPGQMNIQQSENTHFSLAHMGQLQMITYQAMKKAPTNFKE